MRKLLFMFLVFNLNSQTTLNSNSWKTEYTKRKAFVENVGQFDTYETSSTGKIAFAVDFGSTRIYFGKKGISYNFLEAKKIPKEERAAWQATPVVSGEEYKSKEKLIGKYRFKSDEIGMTWFNAQAEVQLIGSEKTFDYQNYTIKDKSGKYQYYSNVKSYDKICYKNIYPNIDVVYTVHPIIGIKYDLIIHEGADPSQIKMIFDRDLSLKNGEIVLPTAFGDIVDHEPITFYKDNKDNFITSKYVQNGKLVTFELGNYDKSKEIVIDPWVQTPSFATNWDCVWEVEKDGNGNVYVLGGIMPMQVLKYNSTGTLQWTYSTPYDTSNVWLGTFATDLNGNSYITAGSTAQIQKINSSGGPGTIWDNTSPGGLLSSAEFWTISFNCDQSSLIVGGTGGGLLALDARIYDIDVNSGNINSQQAVAIGPMFSIPPNLQEVRSVCSAPNGKYYFLTHDTIGYVNSNFTLCPSNSSSLYTNDNQINFGYKCENYRYDNTGISSIRVDENFVYVNTGAQLQKRSLVDASIISSVAIPNGQLNGGFDGNAVSNSGIDLDDCGNIYVGSTTGIYKFNSSLVQQGGLLATSFKVYDVIVSSGGNVIAVGGTGDSNSASRTGGVQSFLAAGACLPLASTCCDATICIPQNVCQNDAPFSLTTASSGGVFSGTGVNAAGLFNPTLAGVGNHTITYTLPCGTESIVITVGSCATLTTCLEDNGTVSVSGGTAPYTWANFESTTISSNDCAACGGIEFFGICTVELPCTLNAQGFVDFGSGLNVTLPQGATQVQVSDNSGAVLVFDPATLNSCSSIPCATITLTTTLLENVDCFGGNNGSATVSATGGTANYSYTWTPGNLTGVSQANLVAGNYTVNILDANNCPGTGTVVISQPNLPLQVDLVSTDDNCSASSGSINATVSGGTAPYSYSWTPNAGNTNLVNNLSAGNYSLTVTDANLCQINASAIVNASATASISINPGSQTISEGSSVQLSASGALTYSWSPSTGLSCNACPNPLASPSITTTYVVTGIDANGCAGTAQITLSIQKNCADIFVPNIFSPNGSGPTLNNAACVFGSCVSELNYTIYDRWGEVVFSTSNVNLSECWDGNFKGKPMNSGVFVYKLIAKLEDGTFINESGNLTLVR